MLIPLLVLEKNLQKDSPLQYKPTYIVPTRTYFGITQSLLNIRLFKYTTRLLNIKNTRVLNIPVNLLNTFEKT